MEHDASPVFASVVRGGVRLVLSDGDPSGNPVELFQSRR